MYIVEKLWEILPISPHKQEKILGIEFAESVAVLKRLRRRASPHYSPFGLSPLCFKACKELLYDMTQL